MKKFKFSLDKLKDYRNQILEKEKNDLARLRREQQQLLDNIAALRSRLEQSQDDFIEKSRQGMSVTQVMFTKNYQQSLSEQIKQLEKDSAELDGRIQKQLTVVVEASKDVTSLDKLEEKQLDEYKFLEAKAQEQFVSEYVLNSTYRQA